MKFVWYEDDWCYYVWKPAWIPTTYWKEKSFLEYMLEEKDNTVVKTLIEQFTKDEEFWLLNRLDNATTGLLYFAKNRDIKKEYKILQKEWRVTKYYVAQVYWDIGYWVRDQWNKIKYAIAHHKFSKKRMVVILPNTDSRKIDSRLHRVETKILEYYYDKNEQIATLLISIQKWIRHQIRSHLSAIGYPIVWDEIYWKRKDCKKWNLQLFSVWLFVE